ncbi:MAG TPA: hypothetical protein V6D14_27125 [Coleofasciculaceae cyanobacterium]
MMSLIANHLDRSPDAIARLLKSLARRLRIHAFKSQNSSRLPNTGICTSQENLNISLLSFCHHCDT